MTVGDYDYKAIDYSKLTVLLLEALHELHAKVGRLERRVETERKVMPEPFDGHCQCSQLDRG